MIKMPEVLSLLFDHMQYTVVVGDYYKKNPQRVIHKTDSLNKVLTQMSSQETDNWKQDDGKLHYPPGIYDGPQRIIQKKMAIRRMIIIRHSLLT